jgi:hypothetical protein
MRYLIVVIALVVSVNLVFSQDDDLILGQTSRGDVAAFYDLSDPTGVNMDVNLWGFVRFPGRYRVSVNTSFLDLMSYSGGPNDESDLEEIRILRNGNDPTKKPEIIKLNYNDLLWNSKVSTNSRINPVLLPGDLILVMREYRFSFREDVGFYLSILTTTISITLLIITISKSY